MEMTPVSPVTTLPDAWLPTVDFDTLPATPEAEAPATVILPPTPLAMPEIGALAYTLCPTSAEFLTQCEEPSAGILQRRIGEARIPADVQAELVYYPDTVNFLAVVGAGLPDTAVLLPLWMRIAKAMPRADLRVVDERALPLLERLLGEEAGVDMESAELPMLLVLDEEWRFQASWGPRPAAAEILLDEWLMQHPEYEALAEAEEGEGAQEQEAWVALTETLFMQMRVWYNSGLDADAAREILALLASLLDVPPDMDTL